MTTICTAGDCARPTDAYLCADHTNELETTLAELPALLDELAITATRQSRAYRAAGRARTIDQDWRSETNALPQTPMPFDFAASRIADEIRNEITTTIRDLCERRGIGVTFADLGTGATWLLRNLDAIRYDECAGDIHHRFTDLSRRGHRAIDRSPDRLNVGPCHATVPEVPVTEVRDGTTYTHRFGGRCEFDLFAPGRVFDGDWLADRAAAGQAVTITCDGWNQDGDGCGATHDVVDREEWLRASIEDAIVPLEVLLAALPKLFPALPKPPRSVVFAWIRQGRLTVIGVDRHGNEMHRGGDLLELVSAYRPHRFAPRPNRQRSA